MGINNYKKMEENDIEKFRKSREIFETKDALRRLKHNEKIGVVECIKEILEYYKTNNKYIEECQNDVNIAMRAYCYILDCLLEDSIRLEEIIKIINSNVLVEKEK